MRVDWAIPCRYVEVNNGLSTVVGAGIDTFYPPEVPAEIGFSLALRLLGADAAGSHNLRIRVLDPEFGEAGNLEAEFEGTPNPTMEPGWEGSAMIAAMVRFGAPVQGAYTLEVTLDGTPPHTVPIRVQLPTG